MMPQCDYDVTDLTDETDSTSMQQNNYFQHNKNGMQFQSHLFINIAPEWVDHLPDDIDGMKIFKIKCLPIE